MSYLTEQIDDQLRAAGIPFEGINIDDDENGTVVAIVYKDTATAAQKSAGDAIADGYDFPLEEARGAKLSAIDQRSAELIAAGFPFDNQQFSLSHHAQINWLGLKANAAALSYPYTVTTKDDREHSIANEAAMNTFLDAAFSAVADATASGRALKQAAVDATTIAQIDAVVDNR